MPQMHRKLQGDIHSQSYHTSTSNRERQREKQSVVWKSVPWQILAATTPSWWDAGEVNKVVFKINVPPNCNSLSLWLNSCAGSDCKVCLLHTRFISGIILTSQVWCTEVNRNFILVSYLLFDCCSESMEGCHVCEIINRLSWGTFLVII